MGNTTAFGTNNEFNNNNGTIIIVTQFNWRSRLCIPPEENRKRLSIHEQECATLEVSNNSPR